MPGKGDQERGPRGRINILNTNTITTEQTDKGSTWTLRAHQGQGVLRMELDTVESMHEPARERTAILEAARLTWTARDLREAAALLLRVAEEMG